jgi:rhodanese-related sulfurtransferase
VIREISVDDLEHRHAAEESFILLDVREREELAQASIPWATWIPMGEIPTRMGELPRDTQIICMCHHGSRSERVAEFLAANGYDAVNLTGGIDAWSRAIDSDVPRY